MFSRNSAYETCDCLMGIQSHMKQHLVFNQESFELSCFSSAYKETAADKVKISMLWLCLLDTSDSEKAISRHPNLNMAQSSLTLHPAGLHDAWPHHKQLPHPFHIQNQPLPASPC